MTGIDTSKALLEEISKERKSESQSLLFEPLLALTGSTLSQAEPVSNLHKCDIPTQLYLSGNFGIPEAILWLYGPIKKPHVDDNDERSMTTDNHHGLVGLDPRFVQAPGAIANADKHNTENYDNESKMREEECVNLSLGFD